MKTICRKPALTHTYTFYKRSGMLASARATYHSVVLFNLLHPLCLSLLSLRTALLPPQYLDHDMAPSLFATVTMNSHLFLRDTDSKLSFTAILAISVVSGAVGIFLLAQAWYHIYINHNSGRKWQWDPFLGLNKRYNLWSR